MKRPLSFCIHLPFQLYLFFFDTVSSLVSNYLWSYHEYQIEISDYSTNSTSTKSKTGNMGTGSSNTRYEFQNRSSFKQSGPSVVPIQFFYPQRVNVNNRIPQKALNANPNLQSPPLQPPSRPHFPILQEWLHTFLPRLLPHPSIRLCLYINR